MIGVDANILLRLLVRDDPPQHELAKAFFAARSENDPAYVSLVVIVETTWVLQKSYGYSRGQVADMLDALLESPDLVIESAATVRQAASWSRQPKVGLIDALVALLAGNQGCVTTFTFDRDAAKRIPGMELLS